MIPEGISIKGYDRVTPFPLVTVSYLAGTERRTGQIEYANAKRKLLQDLAKEGKPVRILQFNGKIQDKTSATAVLFWLGLFLGGVAVIDTVLEIFAPNIKNSIRDWLSRHFKWYRGQNKLRVKNAELIDKSVRSGVGRTRTKYDD